MGNPFRSWPDELEWVNFVKMISKCSLLIALDYLGESVYHEEEKGEQNTLEPGQNEQFVETCYRWEPTPTRYFNDSSAFELESFPKRTRKKVMGF